MTFPRTETSARYHTLVLILLFVPDPIFLSASVAADVRPRRERAGVPGGRGLSDFRLRHPQHGARLRQDNTGEPGRRGGRLSCYIPSGLKYRPNLRGGDLHGGKDEECQ